MSVTVETTLEAVLVASTAVQAIVSGRGYPAVIPIDADLPAYAYQLISDPPEMAHDGPTGTRTARLQYTCTASTYKQARELADTIEAALSGYQAEALETGLGALTVEIDGVIPENKYGSYQTTQQTQTMRLDLLVVYIEN